MIAQLFADVKKEADARNTEVVALTLARLNKPEPFLVPLHRRYGGFQALGPKHDSLNHTIACDCCFFRRLYVARKLEIHKVHKMFRQGWELGRKHNYEHDKTNLCILERNAQEARKQMYLHVCTCGGSADLEVKRAVYIQQFWH